MKKILIVFICFLTWITAKAQTQIGDANSPVYHKNGKIGIGNMNPTSNLDVNGDISISGLKIKKYNWGPMPKDQDQFLFQTNGLWNGATACVELLIYEGHLRAFRKVLVMINNGGGSNNVKIQCTGGTSGDLGLQLRYANRENNSGVTEFYIRKHKDLYWGQYVEVKGYGIDFDFHLGLPPVPIIDNLNQSIQVLSNGNVGIGKPNPNSLLDVAGTITATEIKVEAQTADFVFEDDYKLRPLDEVETFVKENKHLPEIPSAKQMEADGVNVAEMNQLLLQKVEELTLYLIEMKNQSESFKMKSGTEIDLLKQEILKLKKNKTNE